ncbi:MAG: hypothetical protein H6819_12430 [Phycisphaerales bacterium]|nr:hypothetical protein [Phycisphaerales bacterium]MCB9855197.1 hypothetical protein [Phycisphaerales bacterium]MCB9862790.1 hypothetical protein [Phycisphaerales bacterium]
MSVETEAANKNSSPSRKQKILAELMEWLICVSRNPQSWTMWHRLRHGRRYHRAFDDLNLIHRIPHSILDAEYEDNDISFINWGISRYVADRNMSIDISVAWLLIEFVKDVPDDRRGELTWTPPQALFDLAAKHKRGLLYE